MWDFHQSDAARWGRRPRSLSSWHKGHCLSAKSSFLCPTSPLILCCTLNRSLILTRIPPYHPWRQASSMCTETEKNATWFLFLPAFVCVLVCLLPGAASVHFIWFHVHEYMSVIQRHKVPPPKWIEVFAPLFSAASAMDRCAVALMLWHFHKEMDVGGSKRQHSDIYIWKNGCCQAGSERGAHTAVFPSAHPLQSFCREENLDRM